MSLFNLPVEIKEKPVSAQHPWSKSIKDQYSHKIKRAHNTVNNIVYPAPKKKRRDTNRMKFTVIGNRVTKEFIYCVNMVQGMHKYRARRFDAPVIRGVTGVEWPHVLNELKLQYGGQAYCLRSEVAVLCNDAFLGGDEDLKDLIETRYLYHLVLNYQKESTQNFANFVKASGRPCAYLHISIDEKPIGTLIFMLYSDVVPNTCENFLRLCKQTKGGYSGTPIHRIVKDGWIQGGGYGLKETHLTCENFAIPNDRRGVLGMANAGRHIDCSTQFYVLLQPSEWMHGRFVAFGQLIDGEKTLQELEKVNTYYESPTTEIIIHRAGVLNLECKNITINKNTNEYIQKHIEDLVKIADIFYEMLMERVFLEIEFRKIAKLEEKVGEGEGEEKLVEGEAVGEEGQKDIRPTKRFLHKKRDVSEEKPAQEARLFSRSKASKSKSHSRMSSRSKVRKHKDEAEVKEDDENNEFDVEDYDYEPEEFQYSQVSAGLPPTEKPEQPYYLAMTDVPYPGEVDSNFDLKRFLQGDYCLEYDLDHKRPKRIQEVETKKVNVLNAMSEIIESYKLTDSDEEEESSSSSEEDLDSDDEREIKKYLKDFAEHVSFSGHLVRKIAKGYVKNNPIEDKKPNERFTDEEVRRLKLVYTDFKSRDAKKVSIAAEPWETHAQIVRRPTGFVHTAELSKIKHDQDDDEEDKTLDKDMIEQKRAASERMVSIAVPSESTSRAIKRRQTGFVRPEDVAKILKYKEHLREDDDEDDDDDDSDVGDDSDVDKPDADDEDSSMKLPSKVRIASQPTTTSAHPTTKRPRQSVDFEDKNKSTRPSVLVRLYDDVAFDDDEPVPTLKEYKPLSEIKLKKMMLTTSANEDLIGYDYLRRDVSYFRPSSTDYSYDQILNLQHGKKVHRKISSDYVKTIDQIERRGETSLRMVEFARTRPSLSVSQYQMKNQLHAMEEQRRKDEEEEAKEKKHPHHHHQKKDKKPAGKGAMGLRLPGDTPLYGSHQTINEGEQPAAV